MSRMYPVPSMCSPGGRTPRRSDGEEVPVPVEGAHVEGAGVAGRELYAPCPTASSAPGPPCARGRTGRAGRLQHRGAPHPPDLELHLHGVPVAYSLAAPTPSPRAAAPARRRRPARRTARSGIVRAAPSKAPAPGRLLKTAGVLPARICRRWARRGAPCGGQGPRWSGAGHGWTPSRSHWRGEMAGEDRTLSARRAAKRAAARAGPRPGTGAASWPTSPARRTRSRDLLGQHLADAERMHQLRVEEVAQDVEAAPAPGAFAGAGGESRRRLFQEGGDPGAPRGCRRAIALASNFPTMGRRDFRVGASRAPPARASVRSPP